MSKIAVFFAEGFEEIEALTVVDILRRAKLEVSMVSVTGAMSVTSSHGVSVNMDEMIENTNFEDLDMLVLPGGMPGTLNLEACDFLMKKLDEFHEAGKYIGAICAAPSVFGHRGYLKGRRACCYPGFEKHLDGAIVSTNKYELDGNVLTSRGMGTAIRFALEIAALFIGREEADKLANGIVYEEK